MIDRKKTVKILAIDTSSDACSVALLINHKINEKYQLAPRQHTHLILPMIKELVQEQMLSVAKLDALAFSCGPGSFTGIRLAAGIIQGLAFSANLPVIPISTLQTLAQGSYRETAATNVVIAQDARVHEIYWGVYSLSPSQKMLACQPDQLVKPGSVSLPGNKQWTAIGNGWDIYADILKQNCGDQLQTIDTARHPHAYDVANLAYDAFLQGLAVPADQALPVYLRNTDAWKKLTPMKP